MRFIAVLIIIAWQSDYMKILLIKPPQNPNLATNSLYEPLELEYLAASVKGLNVRIIDMRIEKNLHRELNSFRPDLVGLTAYTTDYNAAVQILKEIKKFDRSIKTIVGGHHVTFLPDDFVLPYVDAIFLGYADSTFPLFVNFYNSPEKQKEIPNIGLIDNGKVFFTRKENLVPDLNSLPVPDRSLTLKYHKKYHDPVRNKLTLLMTSRGCAFRCKFCACWKLMDGKYAARTPESIIQELKTLPEDIDIVYFSDDNTFSDIRRMWRLSELIRDNKIKKRFQMYARADTIVKHQDLFADLAESGLQFVTVGLESFSDKDLDYYNKKTTIEINNKAIHILKKLNINIISHFIVRPEYTKEDFKQLLNYVYEYNLFRPAFPVLTPLPGTDLYQETQSTFVITNFDYFDFVHSILPTKLAPREFYRELWKIYSNSFSIYRIIKHRLNRLFSLNKEKYFTDNTDGITVVKLILILVYTITTAVRIRYFYRISNRLLKRKALSV